MVEGARIGGREPTIAFTSTNKIYGGMENVAVVERAARYAFRAQYVVSLGGVRSVPGRAGAHGDTSNLRRESGVQAISPAMGVTSGRRGTSLAGVSAGNDRIEGQQNCCRLRWQSRHPTAKGNSKWNRWPDVREHSARVDATCLKKLSQRSAKVRHGACISNIAGGFAADVI